MDDLKRIKKAVSRKTKEKPIYEPLTIDPLPMEVKRIEIKGEKFAPLFVKLDNYKEILNNIQELKNKMIEINELLRLKRHMNVLKKNSDEVLEKNVKQFILLTGKLEREFGRPKMAEPFVKEEETEIMQSFIDDLENKIKQLEDEVRTIS